MAEVRLDTWRHRSKIFPTILRSDSSLTGCMILHVASAHLTSVTQLVIDNTVKAKKKLLTFKPTALCSFYSFHIHYNFDGHHHQPITVHCWTKSYPITLHLTRSSATLIQLLPATLRIRRSIFDDHFASNVRVELPKAKTNDISFVPNNLKAYCFCYCSYLKNAYVITWLIDLL